MTMTLDAPTDPIAAVENLRRARGDKYRQLVLRIAAGEHPADAETAAETDAILRTADKSIADLSTDVAKHRERCRLRDEMAQKPEIEQRLAELRREIERHNAELEAAVARHQAATHPIQFQIQEANGRIMALSSHERDLFTGCKSPELHAAQKANRQNQLRLDGARSEMIDRIERLQHNERQAREYARRQGETYTTNPSGQKADAKKSNTEAERIAETIRDRERQLAEIDSQIAAGVARSNEIYKEMLAW